jgi:transcriptional regulator with XRE-family HTH domain
MAITAAKKPPNPTDRHIGSRVRMRRKMLAMSQTQLADALGITYQQVQKNERGTNSIAATRLQQISHILQVPIAFFFERAEGISATRLPWKRVDCPDRRLRREFRRLKANRSVHAN